LPSESCPGRVPDRVDAPPLILRRWAPGDAPALLAAVTASLAHLRPWLPWANCEVSLDQEAAFIDHSIRAFEDGSGFHYGAYGADGMSVLGGCGIHRREEAGVVEIGYWVHAAHTRRGYATAAAAAMTRLGLSLPNVRRVEIRCDVANLPSAAVPRRLGYRLDRTVEERLEAPAASGRLIVWVTEIV
jgi:RimJ/RimL family protein N-acetyltransferase